MNKLSRSFLNMPVELYLMMFKYLPFKEIIQFGKICDLFNEIVDYYLEANIFDKIVLRYDSKCIETLLQRTKRLYDLTIKESVNLKYLTNLKILIM